jgi:hypothetical protein
MSSDLRLVLLVLPVIFLAGCGGGSSAAKSVDANGSAPGGSGGAGGTTVSPGGTGGNGVGDAGDDGVLIITPVSPATIASLEGTYALESFTVNPTACDVEGPAETSSHEMTFVIAGGPAARPSLLGLVACSDDLDCADKVAAVRAGSPISGDYVLLLTEEISTNLLRDGSTYPGQFVNGVCTGRRWYASELTRSGNTVRVETRTIPLGDAPSETKTCTSASPAQLVREAQGRTCSALRVFSGTKTGPLP